MTRDAYGLPGVYNASPITIPDGKGGALAVDANGRIITSPSSGGETVSQGTAAALSAGWPVINGELADTTGTITNATQTTPITATGLDGYDNVFVSITGTYATATATFQGSDDAGTTWYNIDTAIRTDSLTMESGFTSLTNTTRAWNINVQGFDNFRVNPSAVASGTVNVRISPEAAPYNPVMTGWPQRLDQVNDAVTAYTASYSYQNITTNATTTLKSGAGVFHGFTVNNNGFTTAGTITIYDNTAGSGTKIGTYTIPLEPPGTVLLATTYVPPQLGLDLAFSTGLTFVTATTAPAADITAIYR